MNWKFWKKIKRPTYYPKCVIKYCRMIDEKGREVPADYIGANFCCLKFRRSFTDRWAHKGGIEFQSDKMSWTRRGEKYPYVEIDETEKIYYCPFCGAKIEMKHVKTKQEKKVKCEKTIIPERVQKTCKSEWQEVK